MEEMISKESSLYLINKIRQCRKMNPKKANKWRKLLKKKIGQVSQDKTKGFKQNEHCISSDLKKKIVPEIGSETLNESEIEYHARELEDELVDLGINDVVMTHPEKFIQVKEILDRFQSINDTRAAGKGGGGGMEDLGLAEYEGEEFLNEEGKSGVLGLDKNNQGDEDDDDDDEDDNVDQKHRNRYGLSKKKLKQLKRPTVSQLKQVCARPEVVESWDTTAPDPKLLVFLKAHRNTVPVPPHWSHKRRYLQGKRGLEKSHFNLPHYIEATRISEIRKAIEEKDSKKTLKQRMREKVRPRHRKMNIDYQTLHDAFFKYATKPVLTIFGDVYFEGKETEMMFRRYTPGKLSARCRDSLGMTSVLDAPPWLANMQRYGPPPSYPNLVIPGVNAHLPEGASLGFQPGGWGKPPGLDQLKVWGVTPRFEEVVLGEDQLEGLDGGDGGYWGTLQAIDSDDNGGQEEDEEETNREGTTLEPLDTTAVHSETSATVNLSGQVTPMAFDPSGIASIASFTAGFATPGLHTVISGMESVSSALDTPQSVDLRRSGFASDSASKPYTILEQSKAPSQNGSLFMSSSIYTIPTTTESS